MRHGVAVEDGPRLADGLRRLACGEVGLRQAAPHTRTLSLSLSVALCPPSPQTSTSVHVSASAEEKTTPKTRGILATTSADATTTATLAANNVPTAAATAATADASAAANAFTAIPYSAPLHPQTLLATDTLHNRVFFPSSCSSALPSSRFHLKGS